MMRSLRFVVASVALCLLGALALAQEEACTCKPMPTFRVTGTDGKGYSQVTLTNRPTIVVFLKAGCPHNPKAMDDLNRLYAACGERVGFVGVTDLNLSAARTYAKELGARFPVLPDPDGAIVKGFGASHSLDLSLTCPVDKRIAVSWNGYSRDILRELLAEIEAHGGPALRLDLTSFPTGRQSGCGF